MAQLSPSLQQAVAVWRVQMAQLRSGEIPQVQAAEIEDRRVTVMVTYDGDVADLRAAGLETGFDDGRKVSGQIALRDVERLAEAPGAIWIDMQPPVKPTLDTTLVELRVPWRVPPTTPWSGMGQGVIVAVIDTGIDIFHESFRKADNTTRILELWDQSSGLTGGAAPPATFAPIGRVYNQTMINAALGGSPPFASVDTEGHGTHVAGIAAGNGRQDDRCSFPGRYVGVAPDADLVIVKAIGLPTGSTSNIPDALRWCAQATTRHPGAKPVVINGSFGSAIGPHDGTAGLDKGVDDILQPAGGPPSGLAVVVAAGNEGASEIHEAGTVAANGTATVSFYVREDSLKQDRLEIWYNGAASLTVTLTAPPNPTLGGSNTTGPVAPGAPGSPYTIGQMSLPILSAGPFSGHNNKKVFFVDFIPTGNAMVRPGVWTLTLTETAGVAANWDAWFATEHGDSYPTFRLPTDLAPTPRRRQNVVGAPGTSVNAITVASYNDDNGELAESSSRGPATLPPLIPVGEIKPTVAATGVGVTSSRSRDDPVVPSSCCDQKVRDMDGTSMASPHVAGLVALMLQKNRTLTQGQIKRILQQSARIDGIPAAEVPPVVDSVNVIRGGTIWGSGKVDAAQALTATPAAGGGGGGGGGGTIEIDEGQWGFTPHTLVSRLGDWRNRYGPRPGLMLFAALVSEHVDEVLRLINHNTKVAAVWRRRGGPLLVRHLLHGPPPDRVLLPERLEDCDVAVLFRSFLPVLDRFGGPRLKADIAAFAGFAAVWPGGDLASLDEAALRFEAAA